MSDRYKGVVVEVDSAMEVERIKKALLLNRYVTCAIPVIDRIFVSFNEMYRSDDMEETIQQFRDIRGVRSVVAAVATHNDYFCRLNEYSELREKLNDCCVKFCGDKTNRIAAEISRSIFVMFDVASKGKSPEKVLEDFLQTLK